MVPFIQICPTLAERETRSFIVESGPCRALPAGEYALLECYCTEPDCDCQRVLFSVLRRSPSRIEATISVGFDPTDDMAEPYLDPLNPQGAHAEEILEFVTALIASDPDYLERLKRHYAITKLIVAGQLRPEDAPASNVLKEMKLVDPGIMRTQRAESGRHSPQDIPAPEFLNRAERRARMKVQRRKR